MSRPALSFPPFRLDIATRELSRQGERVAVPPRSFDCIAYLAQHRDRAVGREELVAAVWGKTSVSDTVLGKTILGARRALGDSVEAPQYIRTVSRFGYHWIAPAEPVDAVAADSPMRPPQEASEPAPASSAAFRPAQPAAGPRATRRRPGLPAFVLAVLVLAAAIYFLLAQRDRGDADTAAMPTTATGWTAAVLPAAVAGRDEDDWLRLGLMDLIAVRLRDAGVRTMPSETLLRLVRPDTPVEAAASALREAGEVQQVLLPSVRRDPAGWTVRIGLRRPEGVTLEVQEQAVDATHAAHAAVDRLLQRLGHVLPATTPGDVPQLPLDALLQRIEAARLGDDLARVRELVAQAPPALAARPEVRLRLAQADMRGGRYDAALHELSTLLPLVSAEADPALRARILYAQGTALILADRFDAAQAAYDQGIALIERHPAADVASRLYMGRGNLAALQGRYEAAAADHARARVAFQLADDLFMTYWLDGNEGALQNHLGRPAAGLPLLRRAEVQFERFKVFNELAVTRANEVVAHLALVQPAEALAAGDRAVAVLPRVADPSLHRLVQLRRAMALAPLGRLTEARTLAETLIAAAVPADETSVIGTAHGLLARIALEQDDAGRAAQQAAAAVELLHGPQDLRARAAAWRVQAQASRRLGRNADAAAATQAFRVWAVRSAHPHALQQAQLAVAEQAAADGSAAAVREFDTALQQAIALDLPRVLVDTVAAHADYLIDRGETAAAIPVAGRIARFAGDDYEAARTQVRLFAALGQATAAASAQARLRALAGERTPSAE